MSDKVALVTGAAAGIGAAISRRFARDGIAVGVLDISLERAAWVADEIVKTGGKAIALQANVASRTDVTAALEKLRKTFGPITIAVNNAGITGITPFEALTDEQWDQMMNINVKGTFIVTQLVLPDMKAAKWGRIVNISSSSAQTGAPRMAHYATSKGAIFALTRTLAREFGPDGITVNNIPPGSISNTLMFESLKDKSGGGHSHDEAFLKTIPVRRTGQPDDVAQACAWLVSDEASYVTGQTIAVNGGRVVS